MCPKLCQLSRLGLCMDMHGRMVCMRCDPAGASIPQGALGSLVLHACTCQIAALAWQALAGPAAPQLPMSHSLKPMSSCRVSAPDHESEPLASPRCAMTAASPKLNTAQVREPIRPNEHILLNTMCFLSCSLLSCGNSNFCRKSLAWVPTNPVSK
jgi:hypothetical protein